MSKTQMEPIYGDNIDKKIAGMLKDKNLTSQERKEIYQQLPELKKGKEEIYVATRKALLDFGKDFGYVGFVQKLHAIDGVAGDGGDDGQLSQAYSAEGRDTQQEAYPIHERVASGPLSAQAEKLTPPELQVSGLGLLGGSPLAGMNDSASLSKSDASGAAGLSMMQQYQSLGRPNVQPLKGTEQISNLPDSPNTIQEAITGIDRYAATLGADHPEVRKYKQIRDSAVRYLSAANGKDPMIPEMYKPMVTQAFVELKKASQGELGGGENVTNGKQTGIPLVEKVVYDVTTAEGRAQKRKAGANAPDRLEASAQVLAAREKKTELVAKTDGITPVVAQPDQSQLSVSDQIVSNPMPSPMPSPIPSHAPKAPSNYGFRFG